MKVRKSRHIDSLVMLKCSHSLSDQFSYEILLRRTLKITIMRLNQIPKCLPEFDLIQSMSNFVINILSFTASLTVGNSDWC